MWIVKNIFDQKLAKYISNVNIIMWVIFTILCCTLLYKTYNEHSKYVPEFLHFLSGVVNEYTHKHYCTTYILMTNVACIYGVRVQRQLMNYQIWRMLTMLLLKCLRDNIIKIFTCVNPSIHISIKILVNICKLFTDMFVIIIFEVNDVI